MQFRFNHFNFNVRSVEKSAAFYAEAFGFRKLSAIEPESGAFRIWFLGDGSGTFRLELTELRDHPQGYDLGECEFHLAVTADDFPAALEKHKAMGAVCFENPEMGVYFVEDPDGYWIEVIPPAE